MFQATEGVLFEHLLGIDGGEERPVGGAQAHIGAPGRRELHAEDGCGAGLVGELPNQVLDLEKEGCGPAQGLSIDACMIYDILYVCNWII